MIEKKIDEILKRFFDKAIPTQYREQVAYWLIGDEDEEEKDRALLHIWENVSEEEDEAIEQSLKRTICKIKSQERPSGRSLYIWRFLRYAGIMLLPIITGISIWQMQEKYYSELNIIEWYIPNAKMQEFQLSDGSSVQVNAGSVLVHPETFKGKERSVFLSGEANFSVAPNAKKPFIVRVGSLIVEVLGTKFNVEAYPGSGYITTTLESGSVKVYKQDKQEEAIVLQPDEQIKYYLHEDRFETYQVRASDYSLWTQGELRFQNKPLNEILMSLERKYDIHFLVDPLINENELYTVRINSHETIEDALYILCQIVGNITYKKEGQSISLISVGKEVRRP